MITKIETTAEETPVVILKEGAEEIEDKEAQKNNVTAARLLAKVALKAKHGTISTVGMGNLFGFLLRSKGNNNQKFPGSQYCTSDDNKLLITGQQER